MDEIEKIIEDWLLGDNENVTHVAYLVDKHIRESQAKKFKELSKSLYKEDQDPESAFGIGWEYVLRRCKEEFIDEEILKGL